MKKLIAVTLVALYLVAFLPVGSAMAEALNQNASITFDPAGGDIYKDQNFEVDIVVNTANQDSAAADVTVVFDSTKLEFVSGVYPPSSTFYPTTIINPIAADGNKIGMARTVSTPGNPNTPITYTKGTGVFATLTFKVKPTAVVNETATLSFDYTPGATGDFTNVSNATSPVADLLGNSTLPTATYTIKAGGTPPPPVGDDPVISSIAPSSGSAANTVRVTINGSNFDEFVDGTSKAYVGTKLVSIISWTDTQIVIEVAAEPDLVNDSVRQVKIRRSDGKEAVWTGYRLIGSGPEVLIFGGITLAALLLAWFVYRRTYTMVPVTAGYAMPMSAMPIMNYQPENPVSQITYRNNQ